MTRAELEAVAEEFLKSLGSTFAIPPEKHAKYLGRPNDYFLEWLFIAGFLAGRDAAADCIEPVDRMHEILIEEIKKLGEKK
jgi:hypothetical protein